MKKKNKTVSKLLRVLKWTILVPVFACVAGFVVLCIVNLYMTQSVKKRMLTVEEAQTLTDVDCIIVLGASVRNGTTPSPMLADRLDRGIELYGRGCSPKLLMSGDHGGIYYDEVNVMKNYAKDKGVPSEDIFMDHAGFSTYESMYRANAVFGAKKVIIVTQKYHLSRALYIAKKMGMDAYGVAAEDIRYSGQTKRDIREFFARGKDYVSCIVKPEPTIVGGYISLDGSGDVTNDK